MREIEYIEASEYADMLELDLAEQEYRGMRDIRDSVAQIGAECGDVPLVSRALDLGRDALSADGISRNYEPDPVAHGEYVSYEIQYI